MAKIAEKHKKKAAPAPAVQKSRQLEKPKYKSFQLSRRLKGDTLPGAFWLFKNTCAVLGRNWKLFLWIVIVYAVLNIVFVQSFSAMANLSDTKAALDQSISGIWGRVAGGLALFAYLVGNTSNNANPASSVYQFIVALLVSLALIWALRQVYAGHKVRMRDTFYNGMYPLIPFIFVLAVIGLQLIPMAVGIMLYGTIIGANIAATGVEQALWALLALVLSMVSFYMITSSIFALYIVTLPDMSPMHALRSARQLVANRRWTIMRKLLFLPVVLFVLAAVIVLPVILFATPVVPLVFYTLSMLLLPMLHGYMYTLYRSLI